LSVWSVSAKTANPALAALAIFTGILGADVAQLQPLIVVLIRLPKVVTHGRRANKSRRPPKNANARWRAVFNAITVHVLIG
jgi:hypothetical protein